MSNLLHFPVWAAAAWRKRGFYSALRRRGFMYVAGILALIMSSGSIAAPNSPAPRWRQLSDVVFQHLTTESGLPQVIVQALAQDSDGFIWAGTQDGLARWDGYQFRTYRANPDDPDSLPDNFISVLHTDRFGRLWIGTNGGGLARYDNRQDRFVRFTSKANGIGDDIIYAIADDGVDGLWVGTQTGLDHFTPADGKVTHYRHDESNAASIPGGPVRSLMRDRSGALWVGTQKGLARFDDKADHFLPVSFPDASGQNPNMRSLFQDSNGRIWIGTAGSGIYILDQTDGIPHSLSQFDHSVKKSGTDMDMDIQEATPNEIWVSTTSGILMVDANTLQTHRIRHDASLPGSLANDTGRAILRDRAGLIWVGTEAGISRHDPTQPAIADVPGGSSRPNSIVDPNVSAMIISQDGMIWLGARNHGISLVDEAATQVTQFVSDNKHPGMSLPDVGIATFTSATHDAVYVGTEHGIYLADKASRRINQMHFPPLDPIIPVNALIRADHTLWIGAENGLWSVDLARDKQVSARIPGAEALAKEIVETLMLDDNKFLWIGTRTSGLYRFDLTSHELVHCRLGNDKLSASSIAIVSLLIDGKGRLWVGTFGGGIYTLVDSRTKASMRFLHLGTPEGLPSLLIDALLEDNNGNIWASTDDGLAEIDPKSMTMRAIRRSDNPTVLPTYWEHSGIKTPQGELLFGGSNGLTVVRPGLLKRWTYQPQLAVTDIHVGGIHKIVSFSPVSSQLQAGKTGEKIVIEPNANSLAVEFSALDFSAPKQNQYAYRLEGYDTEWIFTDASRRLAAYTNLPPGDYQLRLRGSNHAGAWTGHDLRLPISVLPTWYQAWWFQLCKILLAALIIFALVQARTGILRKHRRKLELEVSQRTNELHNNQKKLIESNMGFQDANAKLSQSLETLRQLGEIGQDITAGLDDKVILSALNRHAFALMDVSLIAFYRLNEDSCMLELVYGSEYDLPLPSHSISIDTTDSYIVRTARERQELIIGNDAGQIPQLVGAHIMHSALFAPMIASNRVIGVMTMQSDRHRAYDERERLVFRSLCAYGAIAIDNADAYQQLAKAMQSLKDAQQQLVFQEKMASIGNLTAGFAHEINNPLNFAHVGAQLLRTEIERFRNFLVELAGPDVDAEVLDGLNQGIDGLTSQVLVVSDGTTRIKELVRDLRTFSRLGEAEQKVVAIAESLLSTVKLVRLQYAEIAEIRCDLASNPLLDCWPAQLNQVFMNLIVNGCHAIEIRQRQTGDATRGILDIRSRTQDDCLVLEFEDNGCGIAQEHIGRIFEPFFTTKSSKEGTGLGLSISFGIVERHRGSIEVRSTLGSGSRFTIRLPIVMETGDVPPYL